MPKPKRTPRKTKPSKTTGWKKKKFSVARKVSSSTKGKGSNSGVKRGGVKTKALSRKLRVSVSKRMGSKAKVSKVKGTAGSVKKKADSIPTLFWKLRRALPNLERLSFFELDKRTQELLRQFEGPKNGIPRIEAWTFTLHPDVINALFGPDRKLKRFILTIDTLRSAIYASVKQFLESRSTNITSYYTGGWADFLCDIQMEQSQFDEFLTELRAVLKPGIEQIKGTGKVDEVITYFEVTKQIIMCGRPYKKIVPPSEEAIEELLADRLRFETVHCNYRSAASLELFEKSEKKLRTYLAKLKAQNIIVCYDMIFDFSFGIARDFVPMILTSEQEGPINKILEDSKKEPALIKPIREWFKVKPVRVSDEAEEEINYLFINQYELPGDRTKWKQAIYDHSEMDVNLYNYPLESTLNESAISLSDLPQFLSNAREYKRGTKDRKLFVGWPSHPLLQIAPEVGWPLSGLGGQGVTLGEPNSGKTNTDLLIAGEAADHLKSVLVLDASGGIESKADTLPVNITKKLQKLELTAADNSQINEIISAEGLVYFLKTKKSELPAVFAKFMNKIQSLPDSTFSNDVRRVTKLLIVEEAGDALGNSPEEVKKNVILLKQLLGKAFRKGWCIWLSTQTPSSLGDDDQSAADVLSRLHNRIISTIKSQKEAALIVNTFRNEGYGETDLRFLTTTLSELPTGVGICRAVEIQTGKEERNLPLLKVKFRLLEKPQSIA